MGRGTTTALVLASNAPDIDIVTTAGGALNYLAWHRGPTHGPLGVVGLGLATAALVWAGQRWLDRDRRSEHAPYLTLAGVSIVGVVLHVLMDLPTSYGTRLLSPFSWRWHAIDLMPIVDIYLLIVLAAGLLVGRRSRRPWASPRRWSPWHFWLVELRRAGGGASPRPRRGGAAHGADSAGALCRRGPAVADRHLADRDADQPPRPRGASLPRRDRGDSHLSSRRFAGRSSRGSPIRIRRSISTCWTRACADPAAVNGPLAPWRAAVRYPDQWTPAVLRAAEQPGRAGVPGILEIPGRKLGAERRQHRDGQLDRHALCRLAGAGPEAAFGAVHGHGDGRSGRTGDRRTAGTVGTLERVLARWYRFASLVVLVLAFCVRRLHFEGAASSSDSRRTRTGEHERERRTISRPRT